MNLQGIVSNFSEEDMACKMKVTDSKASGISQLAESEMFTD